jgi:tetratricopeptide (TPR) repeat protein
VVVRFPAKIPGLAASAWNARDYTPMLQPMRVPFALLTSFVLAFFHSSMHAQKSASDQITQAFQLWSEGRPKAAIEILNAMLRSGENSDDDRELGVAWNVLGSAYLDLERYDDAKQAYQHAMEKLRPIPSARAQYASTVDSLARLEESLGQKDLAKALGNKARHIYEELGDSAGVAVTSTNLAVIAYGQRDFKTARRALQRAVHEAQRTTRLIDDDVAAIDATRSVLALHDGRVGEAISTIERAIDLWTNAHGPDYYMLGTGYLVRAQVLAKSRDYAGAISDAQHALAMAEAAVGRNSVAYLSAESIYAQILRASGAKQEGSRLKKEASTALANLQSRRCTGCTVDAAAFR